jgi:WD40 repeat protein
MIREIPASSSVRERGLRVIAKTASTARVKTQILHVGHNSQLPARQGVGLGEVFARRLITKGGENLLRNVVQAAVLAGLWLVAAFVSAVEPLTIEVPARTDGVDFEREVLPILRANCLACHHAQKAESKLVLETPQSILVGGASGAAVVPGKSADSLLLKAAAHLDEPLMPPADNVVGAKNLTPQQLGLIKLWIDQGATGTVSASRNIKWQALPAGYQAIFATAVTPDGQYAVCSRGNQIHVYHVPSGQLAAKLVDADLAAPDVVGAAHRDVVRCLAFDPAGELLASGGFREVKLWRRPLLRQLATWPHEAALSNVTVSRDGKLAATADETGRVRIWDVGSNKTMHTLAHPAPLSGVVFSPDGGLLFAASDKSIYAWKVADGSSVGKPTETASPIKSLALIHEGQWLVSGGADGIVRVWEATSIVGAEVNPLKGIKAHNGNVAALAAIGTQSKEFLSGGEDGLLRRYNAETGEVVKELRHEGPIAAIAVRADGQRLVTIGGGKAKLWKDDGQLMIELADPRPAAKVAAIDAQIAFSKSAIDLAKQEIKSYDGAERRVMTTEMEIKKGEEELAKAQKMVEEKKAALDKAKADNKDAKAIEAAENQLKEAETMVAVANTIIDRAKIVAERAKVDFAKAQEAVAAREVVLKQQEDTKTTAVAAQKDAKPAFRCAAFSSDGQRLMLGCDDGAIHCFTAEAGLPLQTIVPHTVGVRGLAFATDRLFAVADKQTVVFAADGEWKLERTIGSGENPLIDRVLAVDFSRDGQLLTTGGGLPSRGGELKLWRVADGSLVREIKDAHSDTVFSVRFSPDGQHLASCGADRAVKVFSVASGEQVRSFAGHTAHVLSVSWKADSKLLVSCGTDQTIKLWDFTTGLPVRTLKGNTYQIGPYRREVTSAQFIGDSEQILAASGDGTVRLHRITLDQDILTYSGSKGYQYSASATPDGQTLIAGGFDGILRRWVGQNRELKQSFPPP